MQLARKDLRLLERFLIEREEEPSWEFPSTRDQPDAVLCRIKYRWLLYGLFFSGVGNGKRIHFNEEDRPTEAQAKSRTIWIVFRDSFGGLFRGLKTIVGPASIYLFFVM